MDNAGCLLKSVSFISLPLSFYSQLHTLLGLNFPEEEMFGIYCFGSCHERKKNTPLIDNYWKFTFHVY